MSNTLNGMSQENIEAIQTNESDLSLERTMTDDEFNGIVNGRIDSSKAFWNNEYKLEAIQRDNEKLWLNDFINKNDFHKHQTPYSDNRIFTSIETILPMALNSPTMPIVTEAIDSDASRELARNLEHTLLSLYESLDIKYSTMLVIRHLLGGMRYAVMKYRYDDSLGYEMEGGDRQGGFVVETIRPQAIVFDAGATRRRLPFLAEYVQSSGDELMLKFPDKKDEINMQLKQENKRSNQIITYPEIHFEYFKEGKKNCGVGWKYGNINLGRIKNPYYNYDEPESNFFDRPKFPYIIFNYLTMGRYIVDSTSLAEQAKSLQNTVNKRGTQIDTNADAANSGRTVNSKMVSVEDASKLVGDPNETLMVNGNVNEAMGRIAPPLLPDYVFNDKLDARQEIDNIFGTHAPLKGAGSGSKTLGQDMISQNQDKSRIDTIVESLDRGMKELYQGLTQMMCVFWDTPTQVKYTGFDGKSIHMEFDRTKIERGIAVSIKAGSSKKPDDLMERTIALQLAPLLDPLTLAEKLGEDNPKDIAKRITYWKFAMDRYSSEILGDKTDGNMDGDAMADVRAIIANQSPLPPVDEKPTKEYIATLQTFIKSDAFNKMPQETKQTLVEFAKATLMKAQSALKMQPAAPQQTGQDAASIPQGFPPQQTDATAGFSG